MLTTTPPKVPIQNQITQPESNTPPPVQQLDQNELNKVVTPDRLRVPKAFKYPERYRSPTDMMMSPVTKGLLARGKKGAPILPPLKMQPKIPDMCLPMKMDEKLNSS
ncbi:hypothetical protein Lalb_Chr06g0174961 [Lupinus albus]|uniref:Uncharacterized protein n=1 Tax=Lupinus albus TaxID=3870 RepID=A0A6A4QGC4_LUPAL|nr:hypothetical protein Lalb_Chr06g0174961 [Lupinus albus]